MAVGDKLQDDEPERLAFPAAAQRRSGLRIAATAPLEEPIPALSIVAPCYNEQETLDAFCARMVAAARAACGDDFELILVNDGSRDASWRLIQDQARACSNIVGVNLARNHGHQLAVTAGLSLARGGRVMIIDADLQDPPELLGEMMRAHGRGLRRRLRPPPPAGAREPLQAGQRQPFLQAARRHRRGRHPAATPATSG